MLHLAWGRAQKIANDLSTPLGRVHLPQRCDLGGHVNRQAEGELLARAATIVRSTPDLAEIFSFHGRRPFAYVARLLNERRTAAKTSPGLRGAIARRSAANDGTPQVVRHHVTPPTSVPPILAVM